MNAIELGQAIKRKRTSEHLTLRQVEAQLGVTVATLSRIERGIGIPESGTLIRLSDWLRIPVAELAGVQTDAVTYHPQASTPDIIAAHLRVDQNLEPDKAALLIDLFQTMYERMAGK